VPNAVQATELAGNIAASAHDLSMIGLFWQADIVVKAVMVLLLLASFWCWSIIFQKIMSIKAMYVSGSRFEEKFWESNDLDDFYTQYSRKRAHPLHRVYMAGMEEWNLVKGRPPKDADNKRSLLERISQLMLVARNKEIEQMEHGLGFLATIGSTGPFIGLFGTVWGIMNSFQNIAIQKSTNLAVVAPGIAEALFATAIGLFAAIPAVVFYNKISADITKFDGLMEDFSTEFGALISRQLDATR
jgi:biopolymer transport protein TolQ